MNTRTRTLWIAGSVLSLLGILLIVIVLSSSEEDSLYLRSTAFSDGGYMPAAYTCDGEGISPPLLFGNIPKNTKSMMVFVLDLDAPKNGFTQWIVYNIDPAVKAMEQGSIPSGSVEGLNSTNKPGYIAPCPPSGSTHRYLFSAYATSSVYHFLKAPDSDRLKKVMKGEVLGKATFTVKYKRP